MKVHVYRRNGKYMGPFDIPDDTTVENFSKMFYQKYHYYPERQRFHISHPAGPLLEPEGTLRGQGLSGEESSLYFKDLGVQMSWRLVFVIEYVGPLLLLPLFYWLPNLFYRYDAIHAQRSLLSKLLSIGGQSDSVGPLYRSHEQKILIFLMGLHFFKRELESLFVHRFSHATMPLVRLPINCAHYWLLCGVAVGYFLCHPLYVNPWHYNTQSGGGTSLLFYVLISLFLVAEVFNGICHIVLRNLRPRGTRSKGIPRGYGFDLVSCANYMWETVVWITFSLMAGILTSWIFTAVAFGQMAVWALKRHANYRRTFPEYPRNRKAIIPYLL